MRSLPGATDPALVMRLALIEARRRALGCSQADLARALGVSRSTVARLLQGHLGTAPIRGKLATDEGIYRIEMALNVFARATLTHTPAKHATATPRGAERAGSLPARPREKTNTVRIAKWAASDEPVPVLQSRPAAPRGHGAFPPSYRVLIAEDDAATINLYRMVLAEEEGVVYELDFAQTPADCLEHLMSAYRKQPYDLLLMDLGLADVRPDDQRPSLLQRFVQAPELLPQRVLVVSGISPYALQHKRAQLAALGAAFLPKPFDIEELLAVVRALCMAQVPPPGSVAFITAEA